MTILDNKSFIIGRPALSTLFLLYRTINTHETTTIITAICETITLLTNYSFFLCILIFCIVNKLCKFHALQTNCQFFEGILSSNDNLDTSY